MTATLGPDYDNWRSYEGDQDDDTYDPDDPWHDDDYQPPFIDLTQPAPDDLLDSLRPINITEDSR